MHKIFNHKKGIIFDMDGVLLDTEEYHRIAWNKIFATKGIYLEREDYYRCCQSVGRYQAIKNVMPTATDELIQELSMMKGQHFTKIIDTTAIDLYEDAVKLLNAVKELDLKLAIGTSSSMGREVISRTNYKHFFDEIVTGKDIQKNKPHPEIFLKAAKQLELSVENLVVIEDSLVGVRAAVVGGFDTIAINRNDSFKGIDLSDMRVHIKKNKVLKIDSLEELL